MKKPDRMIPFPPHDDPEAVRRFEEETGAIQIVVVTDPLMYRLLARLLCNAADLCFGPNQRSMDDAYALLKDRIGELNEDRQDKIPVPSFGAFKLQVTSDPRVVGSPRFQVARDARYSRRDPVAAMRKRKFWFEACSLFIEMQAAGLRIEGHFPRLDDRSLGVILPALHRAVGGQKERFEPPSARWFRRQVIRMQRDR